MTLALLVLAITATALVVPIFGRSALARRSRARDRAQARAERRAVRDPGRERRAEQRARELLRSCVNDEEWAMYRDLGFIRVRGTLRFEGPGRVLQRRRRRTDYAERPDEPPQQPQAPGYACLIYPHKPIVAYVPESARLLSEYCVEFPDLTAAVGASRLPDSDDVLAKWMALTGDERRLIGRANMHLPGRQVDPSRVRRDIWRLSEWERLRGQDAAGARRSA
ncbi:MAG: hypothetical protein QOE06_907 [Thermoleophilaceae bacterium]|nr:hypothetical protein [Thermoleophilaceae bacterium]